MEGLYKGRLHVNAIEVAWKDEEHRESCFEDGAQVILFLDRRADSSFAQSAPGISCWKVEKVAFGPGRPAKAVSYEFPLDLIAGIPKGAIREAEVVEKSLNFQVPKRKRSDPGGRAPAAPEALEAPKATVEASKSSKPKAKPKPKAEARLKRRPGQARRPVIPGGTAWPPAPSRSAPPPAP